MAYRYGLCIGCGLWAMVQEDQLCDACRAALQNSSERPKNLGMALDTAVAQTFRSIADRHAPALLLDPTVMRMRQREKVRISCDEIHPFLEITDLLVELES